MLYVITFNIFYINDIKFRNMGSKILVFSTYNIINISEKSTRKYKKKYYRFIQDLPLFLPDEKISTSFSKILQKYPVTPYLDSKNSFIRWIHFIHNIINKKLNKKTITMDEFLINYYENYKPKEIINMEYKKNKEKLLYIGLLILLISVSIYLYNK